MHRGECNPRHEAWRRDTPKSCVRGNDRSTKGRGSPQSRHAKASSLENPRKSGLAIGAFRLQGRSFRPVILLSSTSVSSLSTKRRMITPMLSMPRRYLPGALHFFPAPPTSSLSLSTSLTARAPSWLAKLIRRRRGWSPASLAPTHLALRDAQEKHPPTHHEHQHVVHERGILSLDKTHADDALRLAPYTLRLCQAALWEENEPRLSGSLRFLLHHHVLGLRFPGLL